MSKRQRRVPSPTELPTVPLPTEADVLEFVRGYPGRAGALQLNSKRFLEGLSFAPLFIRLGGLSSSDDVIDVGCGAGRMAYALTTVLETGTYEGFDTIEGLVRWAQRSITPAFPQFRFRHVPLYNRVYDPDGTVAPETFEFPYADESFDFAILTSVFTHMLGREIRHYLDELRRVLRPGGRVFATWFLLNVENDEAIRDGRAEFALVHPVEDGYTHEPQNPELAIGFREDDVLRWIAAAGLATVGVHSGSWSGRPSGATYQDVVVAERPGNPRTDADAQNARGPDFAVRERPTMTTGDVRCPGRSRSQAPDAPGFLQRLEKGKL